jgi:hypothetical protein
MQRKAFRAGFDRAWDAKERELAEARAERNAAIARSMSNAMEAQAHEDRARMAEAECERLRPDAERWSKFRAMHQDDGGIIFAVSWLGRRVKKDLDAAIDAARKP